MVDIKLGGHTIAELKTMRQAVAKDAQAFIAEELKKAVDLFSQLRELINAEEQDSKAASDITEAANEAFRNVQLVSEVSGCSFYIGFRDGEYYEQGDVMSDTLRDIRLTSESLRDLYWTLDSMESQSAHWHSSKC